MNENKTNINWYPGHMVKAQNEIKGNLKLIDIVVEILDARIPLSSRNPLIDNIAKGKERIVALNKSDLADDVESAKWKNYFEKQNITCVLLNGNSGENISKLVEKIKILGEKIYSKKYANKKITVKPIYRVLIVGIPNVGKSTIINKISKRQAANVGNKPGVTKKTSWIRVDSNIELLDTPGLLWPKIDDDWTGIKLALTGNIKQEILNVEELATYGIELLLKNPKYRKLLIERFKIKDESFDIPAYEILELIGRKRGCLISGGEVDLEKISNIFLDEIKNGKIGRITLDDIETNK